MPGNKNNIRSKLKAMDRITLNDLAYQLGIKGCEKQEKEELIEKILTFPEDKVLSLLSRPDELPDDPLSLKLNASDRVVLNVVAHDLGIKHDHPEKAGLVKAILDGREREAIYRELEND